MTERLIDVKQRCYAAILKLSICCIQLVNGFHLGQIWATISKSLILNT